MEDIVVFRCPYCTRFSGRKDAKSDWEYKKGFKYKIANLDPKWFVPGAQFYEADKLYTVHAIYLYHTNWSEYDSEDGKWITGSNQNLEWYADSEEGDTLCITEDDGKLYIREELESIPSKYQSFHNKEKHIEEGNFYLDGFKGHDDVQLDRRTAKYKVYKNWGKPDLYVEYHKKGTAKAFKYAHLSRVALEIAKKRDPAEVLAFKPKLEKLNFLRLSFWWTAAAFLAMLLFAFLNKSEPILEHTFRFLPQEGSKRVLQSNTFTLEKNKAYSLKGEWNCPRDNVSQDLSLEILKMPEGEIINTIGCSFYQESGIDEGERWTERKLEDNILFQVQEPGTYSIVCFGNDVLDTGNMSVFVTGILNVSIQEISLLRYALWALLLTSICALVFQYRYENTAVLMGHDKHVFVKYGLEKF